MKHFRLERDYQAAGTLGDWSEVGGPFAMVTVEPARGHDLHPCIQEGTFIFDRWVSPKHGEVFRARYVPGRDGILVHICHAAATHQLLDYVRAGFMLGCIGPGLTKGESHGEPAVFNSIEAFGRFMDHLKDDQSFMLTISSKPKEATVDQTTGKLSKQEIGKHALRIGGFLAAAVVPSVNTMLGSYNLPQMDPAVLGKIWSAGLAVFTVAHADIIPWAKKFFTAAESRSTQP
jgi:hypothetical protein